MEPFGFAEIVPSPAVGKYVSAGVVQKQAEILTIHKRVEHDRIEHNLLPVARGQGHGKLVSAILVAQRKFMEGTVLRPPYALCARPHTYTVDLYGFVASASAFGPVMADCTHIPFAYWIMDPMDNERCFFYALSSEL